MASLSLNSATPSTPALEIPFLIQKATVLVPGEEQVTFLEAIRNAGVHATIVVDGRELTFLDYASRQTDLTFLQQILHDSNYLNEHRGAADRCLKMAIQEGRDQLVQLLVSKGARFNPREIWSAMNAGHPAIADYLISQRSDALQIFKNTCSFQDGTFPYDKWCPNPNLLNPECLKWHGQQGLFDELLSRCPDAAAAIQMLESIYIKNGGQFSYEQWCPDPDELGRFGPECVEWVLQHAPSQFPREADVNAKDSEGNTPLHRACLEGNRDKIRWLLLLGAQVNAQNHKGKTPLHILCKKGDFALVSILEKNNPDWFILDKKGRNPLRILDSKHGSEELAKNIIWRLKTKHGYDEIENVLTPAIATVNGIELPERGISPGNYVYPICRKVIHALQSFPKDQAFDTVRSDLLLALERKTLEEELKDIQQGKLKIIPVGYETHAFTLVFCNGYLAICNRGARPSLKNTIEVYRIRNCDLTKELLQSIYSHAKAKRTEAFDFYYEKLINNITYTDTRDTSPKDLICLEIESHLSPKNQKTGNCTFANIVAGIRAGIALLKIKQLKSQLPHLDSAGLEDAYVLSKLFSTHARFEATEKELSFEYPNVPLAKIVWEKKLQPRYSGEKWRTADGKQFQFTSNKKKRLYESVERVIDLSFYPTLDGHLKDS